MEKKSEVGKDCPFRKGQKYKKMDGTTETIFVPGCENGENCEPCSFRTLPEAVRF